MTPKHTLFMAWLCLCLSITHSAISQNQIVYVDGIVRNYQTKLPVEGVKVYFDNDVTRSVLSNAEGYFKIELSAPLKRKESVRCILEHPDYNLYRKTIEKGRPFQNLEIKLSPKRADKYLTGSINYPYKFNTNGQNSAVYVESYKDYQVASDNNGNFKIVLPSDFSYDTPFTLVIIHPGLRVFKNRYENFRVFPREFNLQYKVIRMNITSWGEIPDEKRREVEVFIKQGGKTHSFGKFTREFANRDLLLPDWLDDQKPFTISFELEGFTNYIKVFDNLNQYAYKRDFKLENKKRIKAEPDPTPNEPEEIIPRPANPERSEPSQPVNPPENAEDEDNILLKLNLSKNVEGIIKSEIKNLEKIKSEKQTELRNIEKKIQNLEEKVRTGNVSLAQKQELEQLQRKKESLEQEIAYKEEEIKQLNARLGDVKALREKADLQHQEEMQKLETRYKNTYIFALTAAIFSLLALVLLLFYFNWERKARKDKLRAEELVIKLENTKKDLDANIKKLKSTNTILAAKNDEIEEKEKNLQESIHEAKTLEEEVRAQKENLERKQKELQELQEARDALIAMIVHDLKNPLNHVVNYSNTDARKKSINEIQKGLIIINQAGRRLNQMSTNILQIQKWESKLMPISPKDYNLYEVAKEAVSQVEIYLRQNGIRLENKIPNDLWGYFDKENIFRVFDNLLSNAVKYTNAGDTIRLEADELNRFVRIDVSDTGKGISAEKMESVFDKFVQDDTKLNTRSSSVGLGLTFCKMVMDAHGTSIDVKSIEGKGTTFSFYLHKSDIKTSAEQVAPRIIEGRKKIELSPEEKTFLQPFVAQIQTEEISFKDISKIEAIVAQIDTSINGGVQVWREALQECAENPDEKRFQLLLNRVLT